MACVDTISWEVHERCLQKLFPHLRQDPENFMRVTIQQVMRAVRQVFMFMIKEDVSLRRLPDNTLQIDTMIIEAIIEALRSYEVSFHLVPLPKTAAPVVKTLKDGGAWNTDLEHWTPTVAPYGTGQGKGKKGKGKKQINVLAKALQHKDNVSQDDHGRRLCFNLIWASAIRPHMEHIARTDAIFAAARDVLPHILFQDIKMIRRIDGSSASRSLLLKVRD